MDPIRRDTTKHDSRLDDAMASEARPLTTGSPVEGHRRDERLQEATTDDEFPIDASSRPGPVSTGSLTGEEAELRRRLVETLDERVEFPADRNALIRALGEADGRGDLSARLRTLPVERVFSNAREVVVAMSGLSTEEPPAGG